MVHDTSCSSACASECNAAALRIRPMCAPTRNPTGGSCDTAHLIHSTLFGRGKRLPTLCAAVFERKTHMQIRLVFSNVSTQTERESHEPKSGDDRPRQLRQKNFIGELQWSSHLRLSQDTMKIADLQMTWQPVGLHSCCPRRIAVSADVIISPMS